MPGPLPTFFTLLSVGVFLWGFERYRTSFVRTEFVISILFALGLLALAYIPNLFDWIGSLLSIQQRMITLLVVINTAMLGVILYLLTLVRNNRTRITDLNRELSIDGATKTDGGRPTIYVVIPAYNEASTITSVLESLPEEISGYDVQPLVVSDGSVDETAERANVEGAMVVEHAINQGQGGALQTGFRVANENGADVVVTMDADGQHPSDELEKVVQPIIDDEAEYVMGSRYLGEANEDNGPVRRVGIRVFTLLINVLTKSSITDCTNGFRAIDTDYLDEMTLTEERFSAPELIIEARKLGMRIEEVPIRVETRQQGESKKPQIGYAVGLFRTVMVTWIR